MASPFRHRLRALSMSTCGPHNQTRMRITTSSVMKSVPSRGSVGSMSMPEAMPGKAQAIRGHADSPRSIDAHHRPGATAHRY
jgi:hypothetical protein